MGRAIQALATILRRISSCTRSSTLRGACPIIRPLAAATTRTAIRPKSDTSTATSTQSAERMEGTFPFHRKRSSGIETTRTAETISALLHRTSFVLRIPCSASRWEVPHEIRVGERQVALPTILLRGMRRADRQTLPAGSWDAPDLLRSQLLCRSLQQRRPASRKSIKSIMSLSRPTKRVL